MIVALDYAIRDFAKDLIPVLFVYLMSNYGTILHSLAMDMAVRVLSPVDMIDDILKLFRVVIMSYVAEFSLFSITRTPRKVSSISKHSRGSDVRVCNVSSSSEETWVAMTNTLCP